MVGVVLGLVYAGASVALEFIGPEALAAALLAGMGPVAMASAWAGWRTHRRVWPTIIATTGLAASGAGYLLCIGTVTGTSTAVLGGITLALAHDANRLLCLRARSVPVPVAILTGFLGSGKTTMLNHVLAQDGMTGTAVIVNELGEVGIDHLLVEHVDERMMYLTSGCLCCAVRGDLIQTLQDVFARMDGARSRVWIGCWSRPRDSLIPCPSCTRSLHLQPLPVDTDWPPWSPPSMRSTGYEHWNDMPRQ